MTHSEGKVAQGIPNRRPASLSDAWLALAGLSAVFLFEMLDNSILNVALPTIGRHLHASTTALQWVTGAYAVVFGGLMLAFSVVADRYGRRRMMLVGLVLLALSSSATVLVNTAGQLIAVRAATGVAAAMTTPGSMALAFRLFPHEVLRVRAINLISMVGLLGLALGPTTGGFVLSVVPWQALLLLNVPIAMLAFAGIVTGIEKDRPEDLHSDPIDVAGAVLGTATIMSVLIAPSLFVNQGSGADSAWALTTCAVLAGIAFVYRERSTRYPLLDFALVARPLVSSGLAYKAASGLAMAGLTYMITLQLQLDWNWSPTRAALGMLPQVVVLIGGGVFVTPFVKRFGLRTSAWASALVVVVGLVVYGLLGRYGYTYVASSLVLVSAGLRVVGVVAANNVLQGLPKNRTTIGIALVDTASQVTTGVGIAVTGTVLAAMFTGNVATANWSVTQTSEFGNAIAVSSFAMAAIAMALVIWGFLRARNVQVEQPAETALAE
jgi:MFS family permease